MTVAKQTPKPVFVRIRVEVGESEYFNYNTKKGDTEVNICILESQLSELNLAQLTQGLLPIAVLKYRACEPE